MVGESSLPCRRYSTRLMHAGDVASTCSIELLREDSHALEVVGTPKDLQPIDAAIKAETRRAETARLEPLAIRT